MKLKSKQTGEIMEFDAVLVSKDVKEGEVVHLEYNSIQKFTDQWEDYEEPKNPYFINWFGEVSELLGHISDREIEKLKEAGNYFETKEEAEKAVEKLKAWKRLKDKGFEFGRVDRYEALCGNGFNIPIKATMPPEAYTDAEVSKDLDICFGGEE